MSNWGSRFKIALITLFITLCMFAAAIVWLLFLYPSQGNDRIMPLADPSGEARFAITTPKVELEKAINGYLHKHIKSDSLSYSIELTDHVKFSGEVIVIGHKVHLTVTFEPILQSNGDMVLVQKSFQVGGLKLPSSLVLEYINRSYTFPEWIALQPAQRQIYVATTAMQTNNGVHIFIHEFDLVRDRLRFDLLWDTQK